MLVFQRVRALFPWPVPRMGDRVWLSEVTGGHPFAASKSVRGTAEGRDGFDLQDMNPSKSPINDYNGR